MKAKSTPKTKRPMPTTSMQHPKMAKAKMPKPKAPKRGKGK